MSDEKTWPDYTAMAEHLYEMVMYSSHNKEVAVDHIKDALAHVQRIGETKGFENYRLLIQKQVL
jgi:hypothetical protein